MSDISVMNPPVDPMTAPVAPSVPAAQPIKKPNGKWRQKIAASERLRQKLLRVWQMSIDYRKGEPLRAMPDNDTVTVPIDWSRTKNKQAQLFTQVPDVKLLARAPDFRQAAPLAAAALNFKLQEEIRLDYTLDEVMADVINAAGFGAVLVSYESETETAQVPSIDLQSRSPEEIAALEAQGGIPQRDAAQPVYSCYKVTRISPKNFLWPVEFKGSDWQTAPWLGFDGRIALAEAKRRGWVPEDYKGTDEQPNPDTELNQSMGDNDHNPVGPTVKYAQIFYKPYFVDPAEKDYRKVNVAVFVDDQKDPVKDEPLTWQTYDPNTKQWMGLTNLPIYVLTLTAISDEAIPPSDSKIGRPQVNELNRSRSQMIKQRDRSMPVRWFDVNMVDEEIAELLRKGVYQDMIPMQGPGNNAIGEVARAQYPRESFEFQRIISGDLDDAWMGGPNQQGIAMPADTSATEANNIQQSFNIRVAYEQAKVARFFVDIAKAVFALMQLFQTDQEWVYLAGQNGAQELQSWDRKAIRGDYIFKVKPDGATKLDVNQQRTDLLNLYKMMRQDPMINPQGLIAQLVEVFGMDPAEILAPPPQPQPEPPNIRYSFKGEDLLNPLAVAKMQQGGEPLKPEDIEAAKQMIQAAFGEMTPPQPAAPDGGMPPEGGESQSPTGDNPEHPGPAPQVNPLNQRYEVSPDQSAT